MPGYFTSCFAGVLLEPGGVLLEPGYFTSKRIGNKTVPLPMIIWKAKVLLTL